MWARNHLVNPVVRALGHSRAHRLLGRHLVLLSYTGRRTGRRFELPVMAAPAGEDLVVVAGGAGGKTWWRNFGADPAEVLVRAGGGDQRRSARRLSPGDPGHAAALEAYRRTFPRGHVPGGSPVVVLTPPDRT
ncbi:nitroreductase/quinone reductase family protein [Modestobacter sp. SSW1-42]|uniref:nitroreductase/quinone reductase family protein n=1 Tax=Modestobacter sp. SSW1-42 TaxID=596372 RepID=UPI0039873E66